MQLAIVVGKLWATAKNPSLEGKRILACRPIDKHGKVIGELFFALDCVGVGSGEKVLFVNGYEASHCFLPELVPTDYTVIAKVDEVAL
ncbi:MAG: EutN/CcmL family microcompartment protein [Holophagae bacterium]|nr:EutN/CcmL family microcompartment protein [Holophagae bacterium]